jgi:hypothetical protein
MPPETKERPALVLPLPRFGRQPIRDPDLPEVTDDQIPTTPEPSPGMSGPQPASSPDESPAPPPVLSPDRRTRTGIFSAPGDGRSAGDPSVAREVIAGLIGIACLWAYTLFGRRGYDFRQPTEPQIGDVARPLGKLVARHLPTDVIGPDLIDITHAAAGAHRYVIAGPLVQRANYASPEPEDIPS